MTAYDASNIFAKILRGEFPCYKVYENDHVLAFLDIMPRSPGHTLVIPKAPARNILDITPEDFAHVARGTRTIARAAMMWSRWAWLATIRVIFTPMSRASARICVDDRPSVAG